MSRPTQVPPDLCEPISPTGLSPAAARFSKTLRLSLHTGTVDGPKPRRMRCHIPGLGSCAFARHYLRNRCYFLFLRVLRCFSSPGSLPAWQDAGRSRRVAPFGNPRLCRVFAPWRGLSQLVTSFVASESQGILHVPLSPFLVSFACKPLSGLSCRADLTSIEVALVTR